MHNYLAPIKADNQRILEAWRSQPDLNTAVRELANEINDAALAAIPVSKNPAEHLLWSHQQTRPHLATFASLDPALEIIANERDYRYTARKVLRRVLDHAIDHLLQIEQWVQWHDKRIEPIPADGWASSQVMLGEDSAPLNNDELQAWLWRIDSTLQTIATRVMTLSPELLHWQPTPDAWSIYTFIHHLAFAQEFYVGAFVNPLPAETEARLQAASQRFEAAFLKAYESVEPTQSFYLSEDEMTLEGLCSHIQKQQQSILTGIVEIS